MTKYLDDSGLEHFFNNIKGLIHSPSYQQISTYLDQHPEATTTIQNGAVSTEKLGNQAVTTNKLGDLAVTSNKIFDNAIITEKIQNGAITDDKLKNQKVNKPKLPNGSVSDGINGQVLRTLGNGNTEWADVSTFKIEDTNAITNAVTSWFREHEEMTIPLGSIGLSHLNSSLADKLPRDPLNEEDIQNIVNNIINNSENEGSSPLIYGYDTATDMTADPNIKVNTIVHTNGFNSSGDGKSAWYKIVSEGNVNGSTILSVQNELKAIQISTEGSVKTSDIEDGAITSQKLGTDVINGLPSMTKLTRGVAIAGSGLAVSGDVVSLDDNVEQIKLGKNRTDASIKFLDNGMTISAEKEVSSEDGTIYTNTIENGNSSLQFAKWSSDEDNSGMDEHPLTLEVHTPVNRTNKNFIGQSSLNLTASGEANLISSSFNQNGSLSQSAGILAKVNANANSAEISLCGNNVILRDGQDTVLRTFNMSDLVNIMIPVTLYSEDPDLTSLDTTARQLKAAKTAELSDLATNYQRMTIFYKDIDNNYGSVDVWNPTNGKRIVLSLTWINGETTQDMYQRVRWVTINEDRIETSLIGQNPRHRVGQIQLNGNDRIVDNHDYIIITRVIGYNRYVNNG